MATAKPALILTVASALMLLGSIGLAVTRMRPDDTFPWGIHLVTVPAVLLLGVIVGWMLRERALAEERARAELDDEKP